MFDSNNGGTDGRGRFVNEISVRRFEFKASNEHRGDVPYHGVAALGPLNERTSGSSGMEAGAKVQLGTQFSDSGGMFVLPETLALKVSSLFSSLSARRSSPSCL